MASPDDGEIVEAKADHVKASSLPLTQGSSVDRRDRNHDRDSYDRDRRASPSSRGYKRTRHEYDSRHRRRDHAPGQSRHDWNSHQDYKRSRISYDDLDRPSAPGSGFNRDLPYRRRDENSRDRYRDNERRRPYSNRNRNRSRSPYRSRYDEREYSSSARNRRGDYGLDYDDHHDSRSSWAPRQATGRPVPPSKTENAKERASVETRAARGPAAASKTVRFADTDDDNVANLRNLPAIDVDFDYDNAKAFDEEAEIERRRKRREEILAKTSSATPLLLHAVGAAEKIAAASPMVPDDNSEQETPQTPQSNSALASSPASHDAMSPGRLDLTDDGALMNKHAASKDADDDGPSAADYDPTADMKEDEQRDEWRHGQAVKTSLEADAEEESRGETMTKTNENDDDDDDEDDGFDMFAEEFDENKYKTKPIFKKFDDAGALADNAGKGGILEGDDKDGYYKVRIGEVFNGRYRIQSTLGRGMFSSVVKAMDVKERKAVAIKIMRNNDALRKGGYTEIAILKKLNEADAENRRHVVVFESFFDYRNHLCMVFENLSMNLREVLRKFGNNVGINLNATRTYAYQMFIALTHMRRCSIIHADLKPDNILVNENRNMLKICDLGTAIDRSDAATANAGITPYLVSRFYRAPEIILGMPYDYCVDMWSIGCTLYELYTGKILFTGDSNNQMLKAMMEIRGKLTPKLFKRGQLSGRHFNEHGHFVSMERDKKLGQTTVRTYAVVKPTRDLRTRLLAASTGMSEVEMKELQQFIDLLEQCLTLNMDKRIKPSEALQHPFFTSRGASGRRV